MSCTARFAHAWGWVVDMVQGMPRSLRLQTCRRPPWNDYMLFRSAELMTD